jgi:hypothetical protein
MEYNIECKYITFKDGTKIKITYKTTGYLYQFKTDEYQYTPRWWPKKPRMQRDFYNFLYIESNISDKYINLDQANITDISKNKLTNISSLNIGNRYCIDKNQKEFILDSIIPCYIFIDTELNIYIYTDKFNRNEYQDKSPYYYINIVKEFNDIQSDPINPSSLDTNDSIPIISISEIKKYEIETECIEELYKGTWGINLSEPHDGIINKDKKRLSTGIIGSDNMIREFSEYGECVYKFSDAINIDWFKKFYEYGLSNKMSKDFYVFRSAKYTPICYDMKNHINKTNKIFYNYGVRSTSYSFDFVNQKWMGDPNNFLFIIKINKNSPYILLHDTEQTEISIAPGKFIINDIKKYHNNDKISLVFIVDYIPYSLDEIIYRFTELQSIQKTIYTGNPILLIENKIEFERELRRKYEFNYRYGGYYQKYLKYKNKYLQLKNNIIN